MNPEQSKEAGFWSLEENEGVPSPTKVTCDVCLCVLNIENFRRSQSSIIDEPEKKANSVLNVL
jgi:hypothetical protein